jgi:hypothetical protein
MQEVVGRQCVVAMAWHVSGGRYLLAIGQTAVGVVSIGQVSVGIINIGWVGVGVLFSAVGGSCHLSN